MSPVLTLLPRPLHTGFLIGTAVPVVIGLLLAPPTPLLLFRMGVVPSVLLAYLALTGIAFAIAPILRLNCFPVSVSSLLLIGPIAGRPLGTFIIHCSVLVLVVRMVRTACPVVKYPGGVANLAAVDTTGEVETFQLMLLRSSLLL